MASVEEHFEFEVTSDPNAGLPISNTSGPNGQISYLDRLCVVIP